ncbi:MAG: hypothetical protein ABIN97_03405 [Ginsengibacter sp.]
MAALYLTDDSIQEIVSEAKKMKKADRRLLLKELRIRRLLAENKPIVKAKKTKALSLKEINEIKHLSRKINA